MWNDKESNENKNIRNEWLDVNGFIIGCIKAVWMGGKNRGDVVYDHEYVLYKEDDVFCVGNWKIPFVHLILR